MPSFLEMIFHVQREMSRACAQDDAFKRIEDDKSADVIPAGAGTSVAATRTYFNLATPLKQTFPLR